MSTRDGLSQNIPGYHIYESVPGMLSAMYQGVDAVAMAAAGRVLSVSACTPARLVAEVERQQRAGRLPRPGAL